MTPERHLVLWFPDWPVRAACGPPPHGPVAVMQAGTVLACSPDARVEGVRIGQRRRLAQGLAPGLRLIDADPQRDERAFLPVVRLLESLSPGIQPIRPGLIALRARGVVRYYGGEEEAAQALLTALGRHDHANTRAAIADGLFAAEVAARHADPVRIVPSGQSGEFLAPLPLRTLGDEELSGFLSRLGVRTLGAFAAMASHQIRDRFGERGARLHFLASGKDSRVPTGYRPEPERARSVRWDDPLTQAEQVAFAVRQTTERVIDDLAAADLVCTELRIEFTDEDGTVSSRLWMHPAFFAASDLVDRVRWQLEGFADEDGQRRSGIVGARFLPIRIESSAPHQPGLFGQGPDERLHHAVSRLQGFLGHRGVLTAEIGGGRRLGDRQLLTPWGDRQKKTRDAALPWPGGLPAPLPAEIFDPPRSIRVTDESGEEPRVDDRGALSAAPAAVEEVPVHSWAGPWPLREQSWEPSKSRIAHRFQIIDAKGRAWLLLWDRDAGWRAEGRYA